MRKTLFKSSSVLYNELVKKTRCAACQNELEAYVAIVTGAQPIDYFDTFVSEWKRLGGDAIAQEVQEYFAQ